MCVSVCVCVFMCACVWLSLIFAAPLTRFGRTMGRMQCDSEPLRIGALVMSHSLIRSLVRSHRALIRLLHTARFARAPLRSFARLLAQSLAPALVGQWNIFVQFSMGPESQWNDHEIDAQSTGPFTRLLARSLAPHTRTAHSFAFSALLALLTRFAALICSFSRSPIHSLPSSWEKGFCL